MDGRTGKFVSWKKLNKYVCVLCCIVIHVREVHDRVRVALTTFYLFRLQGKFFMSSIVIQAKCN